MKRLTHWLEGYDAQPYMAKLHAALQAGKVTPGMVTEAVVMHDDDCPLLAGSGLCQCNPRVRLVATN